MSRVLVETGSSAMLDDFARWTEREHLHPVIAAVRPVAEAAAAFRQLQAQTAMGKICIAM